MTRSRIPARLRCLLAADPSLGDRILSIVDCDTAPKVVRGPADIAAVVGSLLAGRADEALVCVALDRRGRVLASTVLTTGCDGFTIVEPRQIFRWALTCASRVPTSIALAHNHPSGDPTPSTQDVDCTRRVAGAGRVLGVRLVDHIVYADGPNGPTWRSLAENGDVPTYNDNVGYTS